MPLHDRCLKEGGRSIRVILQQNGLAPAVQHHIKPAIEGKFILLPGLPDQGHMAGRDAEVFPSVVFDDVFRSFEIELVDFAGGFFQQSDFHLIQLVGRAFVPVGGGGIVVMPCQTQLLDLRFPIRAWSQVLADHERPEKKLPLRPKPPRLDE